ncbi:choice-of-anchor B family protein [Amycolatopsis cihanbeyliensis]|uniref:Choice-of-anchor B domain-containing protein n=1 Tax=Amycolatopsis cihanbeyliensis TaxID=1128664 RepID=A0A542CS70_AMYCI|nr:choice-of-anchor B family protein [Amycolatopsis cihanbeyliensis]TQI93669.1 choice-of-anchor B domain-containing protein [Amycolatopsis cihanbeyliensis]
MRLSRNPIALVAVTAAALAMSVIPASAHDPDTPEGKAAAQAYENDRIPTERVPAVRGSAVSCQNGMADRYPCRNVDLQSTLPLSSIGGGQGNDIWGWTDPATNREYALLGRTNGTAFVDVTDPVNPRYLGNLPSNGGTSSWRDVKVHRNHAFVVADAIRGHGMQVFDLTRLRGVSSPQTFRVDAQYSRFGPAHNIVINEESGYAYAVGSNTCSGGPHMINIADPKNPVGAGCVSRDGYTHDAQCVDYHGPDRDYQGREICLNSNEDTLTIVDVTDKDAPRQIARRAYSGVAYSHQGWFTEDQRYYVHDDELDESRSWDGRTKTYMFDLTDLDNPRPHGTYTAPVVSIDHNQYIKGDHSYQANYQSGLRILDVSRVAEGRLSEVGYFDVHPRSNEARFNGAWSVYPYFASGNVIINSIEQGLFVVRPRI